MVALTRRGVALLAIAAWATTALAAEGPAESPEVGFEVAEQPQQPEPVPGRKGVSPGTLAGAAVGAALLTAIVLFGIKVLGSKLVQTDEENAPSKIADEVLGYTDKMTVSTGSAFYYIDVTFGGDSRDAIKKMSEEDKNKTRDDISDALKVLFGGSTGSGQSVFEFKVGEGSVRIAIDRRSTQATAESTGEASS